MSHKKTSLYTAKGKGASKKQKIMRRHCVLWPATQPKQKNEGFLCMNSQHIQEFLIKLAQITNQISFQNLKLFFPHLATNQPTTRWRRFKYF